MLRAYTFWSDVALRALGGRRERRVVGGVDFALHRLGPPDGEPWVLLHGLGALAASWLPVVPTLRRTARLLVPELSILGGTQGPGDGLNAPEGAAAIAALIEAEFPGERVTVAGISLGGWMAVRLAMARPELLARMVLINAGGYRDQDWENVQRLVNVQSMGDVDTLCAALFRRSPWYLPLARRSFFSAYTHPAVQRILATTDPAHAFGRQDLMRIETPTAVVWGEHDGLFPAEVGRAMADALPLSRFYLIADSAHIAHWEQPGAMNAALADFRRRFPLPGGGPALARTA